MTSVSCIVPTHARPDLLAEALRTVGAQTARDVIREVVVVDDEGDARTEEVALAAAAAGLPIRYVRNPLQGASASRNLGAEVATGDVLAFLDDDDLWDPAYLLSSLRALETSGADMSIASLDVLEVNGKRFPFRQIPASITATQAAGRNPGFTGSNFLIQRTSYHSVGGFDPKLLVSNDKDFLVRFLLARFRYVTLSEGLVVHRRHSGPQLTAGDERRALGLEQFMAKHGDILDRRGRRFLRKTVHAIRRRTATRTRTKAWHTLAYVANISREDLRSKWLRRRGGFSEAAE